MKEAIASVPQLPACDHTGREHNGDESPAESFVDLLRWNRSEALGNLGGNKNLLREAIEVLASRFPSLFPVAMAKFDARGRGSPQPEERTW